MSGLVCLWRTTPRNMNFKLLVLTPAPFNVANGFEGNRSQNKFSNSTLKGAAPTNLCKPNRHNFKLILRGLDGHRCLTRQRAPPSVWKTTNRLFVFPCSSHYLSARRAAP